ncbi:SWAP (Suppressor-of-White-APricot)/surp domain-containing protein [Actinidia rufa]|uniref:SWAP (Suppressor-of-White-APricot)/surp domain-containing protein n=1 Tax=Actinidia rufa TaxID=165716 RepID=A0A7J0DR46_9ERIC|nr:SWAP (Suppressor-of-White-APricot)/surp domain-containing protein [Actinidia rufa]
MTLGCSWEDISRNSAVAQWRYRIRRVQDKMGERVGRVKEVSASRSAVVKTSGCLLNWEMTLSFTELVRGALLMVVHETENCLRKLVGGWEYRKTLQPDSILQLFPRIFVPRHLFSAPFDINNKFSEAPPPEVPPPEDNNLKVLIEGVAALVARCGKLFEDLSREKNQSNPLFSFLNGGHGHDYYSRKLWEAQQKRTEHKKLELDGKVFPSVQKMTAESRGKILGERPLERSSNDTSSASTSADIQLQFNLSDTFTKPASFNELPDVAKPFRDDPAKQGRFEQFLKEKYHGGLRSKDSSGSSYMSEAARAREKLEFEAAAEAIRTGKWGKETGLANQQFIELSVTTGLQFTSAGLEQGSQEEDLMKKMYPKREEFQWRPSPILCKRFDIMDPYMGKPPPPPRVRSKMDSLIFMPDSVKHAQVEETKAYSDSLPVPQSGMEDISKKEADREVEVDVEVENVERPVDLYKAIFSDDSDDEEESSSVNQMEDPQKKVEAANTTLNRLIAGDFLESLGKELGLEVPPDLLPHLENKAMTSASQKENDSANKGKINAFVSENKSSSTLNTVNRTFINQDAEESKEYQRDDVVESSGNIIETLSSEKKSGKVELGKVAQVDRINRTPSDRHRNRSSSSSEDERRRKRSRRHRHRSSSSDSDTSDSSDDYRDRHHSRSKGRKQESSREKSSSRKHSKHRKRDRWDSLGRSHRDSEKDRETAKREKRR